MTKTVISWAAREKRRSVNAAVGRNFLKTVTEPVTNSDSALKKQSSVPHGAGLIDELLTLRVGDRVNTAELKTRIPKTKTRVIDVALATAGKNARLCRVVDTGPGMSRAELQDKFSSYAGAKAKGENTRSLFGRGALDVLLYHEESVIYSVQNRLLSRCRIYWDQRTSGDAICEVDELGPVTKRLLDAHELPHEISESGTVVQFLLREGTHIPNEEQIIAKISSFYMLRLIAADPNTKVVVQRKRADGSHSDRLNYDFPIGSVLSRIDDEIDLGTDGKYPVNILVARSDVPLESDPINIERRENGLLFVDENDAVFDLTLLPDYEKNPYLKHIYGVVRIVGMRKLLESKLEADEAVAILTATRDGFDRKHEITQKLFVLVEKHVKPIYEKEEKQQRKGDANRSEQLDHRVKEALKAINQFNADETEEDGKGKPTPPPRPEPIYFSVDTLRLYAGAPRRIYAYVNLGKVNNGEIILFGSDNTEIKLEPDSETVKGDSSRTHQRIELLVTCEVKGEKGYITALTLDKTGNEARASIEILGVDDPPLFLPPEDIAFAAPRFSGDPNRVNKAVLLVNLTAFTGMPEVSFWLEENVGNVSLGDGADRVYVKVKPENVMEGQRVARVAVPFKATGWGQRAVLCAKAKRSDGKNAYAKCRIKFEHQLGNQKFSNFHYEDLDRPVLGDVAGDKLYINAGYALHRQIFGDTEDDFNKQLESNPIAQMRAATVLVETAVYHAATVKHQAGGAKGLHIDPEDPIGSLRPYVEEGRMKLEPRVFRALAPEAAQESRSN
jgi:hypothetical protein